MSLAALGASGFLAVYVLGMNPRGRANRAFFVLMLTFVLWDACEAIVRSLPPGVPDADAFVWIQGIWVGISLVPAALMHLALTYPEERPLLGHRRTILLAYAPVFGWAYLIFGTHLLIAGVSSNPLGPSAHVGSEYALLALVYAVWFYLAVGLFVAAWWRVRESPLRRVQGVVVLGLLLATVLSGITEVFWPLLSSGDTPFGLASLYTLIWSIFLAVSITRYGYLVIEPVMEARTNLRARHPVQAGLNYLVVEPGRSAGMGAFRELVSAVPGLCVTGLAPGRVTQRFGLERTPVLWITNATTEGRAVRPQGLDFELLHTVVKFLRENPGAAVLLDDLDYLASVDGFEAVARFLKRVANQASASGGTLIVTAGRETFTADQLAVLKGCVDRVLEVEEAHEQDLRASRQHELFVMSIQDAPLALTLLEAPQGLLLTTDHPTKARRKFGGRFDVLWIAEQPNDGPGFVRASALDTEGKRALAGYVAAHPGADLFLVGLEQFALLSTFPALLSFVKDALDVASAGGCRLVATLSPGALSTQEVAMLARRFDVPSSHVPLRGSPSGGTATAVAGSRTPSRGPVS